METLGKTDICSGDIVRLYSWIIKWSQTVMALHAQEENASDPASVQLCNLYQLLDRSFVLRSMKCRELRLLWLQGPACILTEGLWLAAFGL